MTPPLPVRLRPHFTVVQVAVSPTSLLAIQSTSLLNQGWDVVTFGRNRVLLMDVHGSRCGGINPTPCVEALAWDQEAKVVALRAAGTGAVVPKKRMDKRLAGPTVQQATRESHLMAAADPSNQSDATSIGTPLDYSRVRLPLLPGVGGLQPCYQTFDRGSFCPNIMPRG